MSKKKSYTAEQKFQIVKEALTTDSSVSDVCKKYSINPTNFYKWQATFFESAMEGFNKKKGRISHQADNKITELEKSNQRMKDVIAEITAENIDLKKKI